MVPLQVVNQALLDCWLKDSGFYYLYTGLLYLLGYLLLRDFGYDVAQACCPELLSIQAIFDKNDFEYYYTPEQGAGIRYRNEDITQFLKTMSVDTVASVIKRIPCSARTYTAISKNFGRTISYDCRRKRLWDRCFSSR